MPADTAKHVSATQMAVARTANRLPTAGRITRMLASTAAMVGGRVKLRASLDSWAVNGPRSRKIR